MEQHASKIHPYESTNCSSTDETKIVHTFCFPLLFVQISYLYSEYLKRESTSAHLHFSLMFSTVLCDNNFACSLQKQFKLNMSHRGIQVGLPFQFPGRLIESRDGGTSSIFKIKRNAITGLPLLWNDHLLCHLHTLLTLSLICTF